jgi:hypothetical protein
MQMRAILGFREVGRIRTAPKLGETICDPTVGSAGFLCESFDYLGLADQLKKALITYTESGGQGNPTFDTAQAIAVMLEKHGIACDLIHQPAPLSESPFFVYAILS